MRYVNFSFKINNYYIHLYKTTEFSSWILYKYKSILFIKNKTKQNLYYLSYSNNVIEYKHLYFQYKWSHIIIFISITVSKIAIIIINYTIFILKIVTFSLWIRSRYSVVCVCICIKRIRVRTVVFFNFIAEWCVKIWHAVWVLQIIYFSSEIKDTKNNRYNNDNY